MDTKPSLKSNVLLVLGSTVLTLLLLEGAFRWIKPVQSPWLDNSEKAQRVRENSIVRLSKNNQLLFVVRENYIRKGKRVTEAHGIHQSKDASVSKPKGTYRIAVIGDSISQGSKKINHGPTFVNRLEKLFKRRPDILKNKKRVEVLNFGVVGYGPMQEAILLETKVLRFSPDLIILQFCPNDVGDSYSPRVYFLKKRFAFSALLSFFQRRYDLKESSALGEKYTTTLGPRNPLYARHWETFYNLEGKGWKRLEQAYRRIAKVTQSRNIPVLFVYFPFIIKPGRFRELVENFRLQVLTMVKETSFQILDLTKLYQSYPPALLREAQWDDLHLSALGNQKVAEAIFLYLTSPKNRKHFPF